MGAVRGVHRRHRSGTHPDLTPRVGVRPVRVGGSRCRGRGGARVTRPPGAGVVVRVSRPPSSGEWRQRAVGPSRNRVVSACGRSAPGHRGAGGTQARLACVVSVTCAPWSPSWGAGWRGPGGVGAPAGATSPSIRIEPSETEQCLSSRLRPAGPRAVARTRASSRARARSSPPVAGSIRRLATADPRPLI